MNTPLRLSDARFMLDGDSTPWSIRGSLTTGVWPPLPAGPLSLRTVCGRYAEAGLALRSLAASTHNAWSGVIVRDTIVAELRDRVRDPAILRQNPTGLCGPFAIVFELLRRRPTEAIHAALQLLETGEWKTLNGRTIEAEEELRAEPVPQGAIEQVDWLLAATMRDDENIWEDVDDDANGLESMTFWSEMKGWTKDVLGLKAKVVMCWSTGEASALRKAQLAVEAGGVAFLLIDASLISAEPGTEEDTYHHHSQHVARSPATPFGPWVHGGNDDFPDHWVAYLGGLPVDTALRDAELVSLRLWSWGREYGVKGTVDAISEYLYCVVTGVPA